MALYDYSYGEICIYITDEGYEYSDDDDNNDTRCILDSVSQLKDLIEMIDNRHEND